MITFNKLKVFTGVAAFAFTIVFLIEPSVTYAAGSFPSGSFIDAYQKEYAFLQAEKDSLKKRLTEMDAELIKKEVAAKNELSALESKLLYIQDRCDSMEMDLDETTSDRSDMEERMDILKETISRAKDTLEGYGLELTKASDNADVLAKQVVNTLAKSVDAMKTGREVSVNDGEFFNLKGKKIKGKIVKIGHIAAYGVSDEGSGALAPAGAGGLKLWNSTTAGDAKAIMGNNIPKEISMF
ncbi:MAG: hypothetical protein JXR91_13610, partial [Deltaproteobacteria bacterium]|nr:hypothetical protein [Deltaproteobacteria bacterium]